MTFLDIKNLVIHFKSQMGNVHAVDGVSFGLHEGEILGLAGESGCGKTTSALSIPRLLPDNAMIIKGNIVFNDEDLLLKNENEMEHIRWRKIAVVFQGAMNALNPVKTIENQIIEPIFQHEPGISHREAKHRALDLLIQVGIEPSRARNYPHEFSGGMRQRAMIAMSLVCKPKLVIADEPVTALDVMIQAQIMNLLKELVSKFNLSMILISHDLSIIAETCSSVVIMYAGKILEKGSVSSVFSHPAHPYTQALIRAFPDIHKTREFVEGIPGYPPNLIHPPEGCRFFERCKVRLVNCQDEEPSMTILESNQQAACHLLNK